MTLAIETRALTKTFGDTHALDGVNLQVEQGAVYGLLGPNGAGKTTAVRVLATLLRPTSGTASVLGHDVVTASKAVRERISVTGQFASVDDDLTGIENLILVGRLLGLPRRDAKERAAGLLDAFGLADASRKLVGTYSGGMRRRLDIATSLVVTPDLLFLDEPTTGLDPRSRNQVWDIVRAIAATGTTVLLTTQYLEEADRLADRLAVIDQGRVIAEGTSHDLKAEVGADTLHVRVRRARDRDAARELLQRVHGHAFVAGNDPHEVVGPIDPTDVQETIDRLRRADIEVSGYAVGAPTLDEVFFALTGRPAEPAVGADRPGDGAGAAGARAPDAPRTQEVSR